MNELTRQTWIEKATHLIESGASMDEILAALRAEGGNQIDSVIVLRSAAGLDLKKAKHTVHFSAAWADAKERQERFWAELTGDCLHCGHSIGYHHLDGDKCSCKDCPCPGFEDRSKDHE